MQVYPNALYRLAHLAMEKPVSVRVPAIQPWLVRARRTTPNNCAVGEMVSDMAMG
tara:strand:+ start:744 stop:908 length:165 start_codon:yes stop_codon:yes gene_type:complete